MDELKKYIDDEISNRQSFINDFIESIEDRWNENKSEGGRIKNGAFEYIGNKMVIEALENIKKEIKNKNPILLENENDKKYLEEIKLAKENLKSLLNEELNDIKFITIIKDKKTGEILGAIREYIDDYSERYDIEEIKLYTDVYMMNLLKNIKSSRRKI